MSHREPPPKPRAILHIDMDAFYASVEMLDDPSLRGKPVMVGGTPEGRGVVAAASYEARKFGVHSAMSAFKAHKLCPQGIFLRPRFSRYSEISRQFFAIFHEYTPHVEPISIDEAFLDVTGSQSLFGPAEQIGRTIKRRIREEVGLDRLGRDSRPTNFWPSWPATWKSPTGSWSLKHRRGRADAWLRCRSSANSGASARVTAGGRWPSIGVRRVRGPVGGSRMKSLEAAFGLLCPAPLLELAQRDRRAAGGHWR